MCWVFKMSQVRKSFRDKVVLNHVSLTVASGAKVGVIGPNGVGKSTLLRIMAGLEEPSSGAARFARDATVGVLPQELG